MIFRYVVVCVVAVSISACSADLEGQVPSLFDPQGSSTGRLASFVQAMSWEPSEAAGKLRTIQPLVSNLHVLLAKNLPILSPFLPHNSFPYPRLRSLSVYGPLFSALFDVDPSLFGLVLVKNLTLDHIYKVIAIVQSRVTQSEISRLCVFIEELLTAESHSVRFACTKNDRSQLLNLARVLDYRDLQFLFFGIGKIPESRYMRRTMEIFIKEKFHKFYFPPGDEIFARTMLVPPEVHPLYKFLCTENKVAWFCMRLISEYAELEISIQNFHVKLGVLQRYSSEFGKLGIAGEQVLGFREHPSDLVKILHNAKMHIPEWNLFRRLLEAETLNDRLMEAEMAKYARSVVTAVNNRCEEISMNSNECVEFPESLLKLRWRDLNEFRISLAPESVIAETVALKFVQKRKSRFGEFIKGRIRKFEVNDTKECGICLEKFGEHKQAVEFCPPCEEFEGHFFCQVCTRDLLETKAEILCPICRQVVLEGHPRGASVINVYWVIAAGSFSAMLAVKHPVLFVILASAMLMSRYF